MDKRSIATRKKIRDAYFYLLLNKKPLNVRSIVREAHINKSTFYRYYTYIEELEDELITELSKKVYLDSNKGPSEKTFAENFFYSVANLNDADKALFFNNIVKTTETFVNYAFDEYKKVENDIINQLIFYIIGSGCVQLFINRRFKREDKEKAIILIAKAYQDLATNNERK